MKKKSSQSKISLEPIEHRIFFFRGQKVLLVRRSLSSYRVSVVSSPKSFIGDPFWTMDSRFRGNDKPSTNLLNSVLDSDLAQIYGVSTKALNQAVKRNKDKFPIDFMFQLSEKELYLNRSQFVTGSKKHRDPKFLPYVFTEHGAVMAANVLNSRQAVAMSVFVVRAFIKLREVLAGNKELAEKLTQLERRLTKRLDVHEAAILRLFSEIRELLNPPPPQPEPQKRPIGFH